MSFSLYSISGRFTLVAMLCIGLCCLLPQIGYAQVNEKLPGKVISKSKILQDTIPLQQDTIPYEDKQQRIEQNGQPLERFVRSADLEVDGLIVDETITKIGRDFYDLFNRQWETPLGVKNFTIQIQERPTRGNGAYIVIVVNDEPVFEYILQPRYDMIEEVSVYAVAFITEYVVNNQLNQQLEAEGKKAREVF
ncbi:CsgE family curli-type amyloid fiber assembly protein [Pontibacter sp. BAB1700]|uniref:CsgE family curli-type amyloid fiber assembly protein n=1 Tax=Pontibacter sp. BAB1700 TaxID=1144253 RepID=UPI00058E850D|nr:CsgE family curli-type amyloid fiber assembly protein [Pontibacter sp. BAB1700]